MSDRLPITPSVLKWARKRSGLTIDEMSKSFKPYNKWEEGEISPTYIQLEQLADKFKCPIAVFFFPEPPNIEPIEKSFRTLPEIEFDFMPRSIVMLMRKAKALQLNLMELNDGINPSKNFIINEFRDILNIPIDKLTKMIRSYISVPLEEQSSWKGVDIALNQWRNKFIDYGIYVFKDAFRADEYSGFCLYDDQFPIIVINNSNAKSKQIFTLFHELMHLLSRTSGIDKIKDNYINSLLDDDRKIEILCNKFSGEFLVPNDDFNRSIQNIEVNEDNVYKLAKKYNVSKEVILRKFLDKGMTTTSYYEKMAEIWANLSKQKRIKDKKEGKIKGNFYSNKIHYLSRPYINLVLSKYNQNKIDALQRSEFLTIEPRQFSKFEDKFNSIGNTGSDS